ncbi:SLC13 family permease [Oerskovia enterophila]|uniref:Arsenical pump membrane protein n=1 Tax=Oerskovia enterophila TaxID=43678 RepID=A0A163SHK6_9CELL|nr:SLC13 family permease [Oerskovia enterophila]KZM36440.1 arsenical pump membrane protein [Oerskovia enterophila]
MVGRRVRVPLWAVAVALAALVVAVGWLPLDAAEELAERVGPILLFLVAITVVAEMCAAAGLFDAAASWAVRLARGSRLRLWGLVVLLACVCTIVLSLDTTAVLVTPVVLTLARRTGSRPLPFALTVLALANTASLLLPVSNLTNLLAAHRYARLEPGTSYTATMWLPALVVIAVTVLYLLVAHHRDLRGTFEASAPTAERDPVLLPLAALVTVALGVCFAVGLPVAVVALGGAGVLLTVTLVRRRDLVAPVGELVPWRTVLVVASLFVAVEAWQVHGLGDLLARFAGTGTGTGDLLQVAGAGAVAANAVNNLPAYLALEPAAAGDPARLAALLVGVDAGPLVTPWASVATVLWWVQCSRHWMGFREVGWWPLVRQGLVLAPLAVVAGTLVVAAVA